MENEPNFRRAIRRSQRARNAFNRRKRRAAIAAWALIAASVPASLAFVGVGTGDVARAAESGARSLADLLSQRSPGERTQAQLSKMRKARALPKLRQAAAAPPVKGPSPLELANILLPPAEEELPVDLATAPQPPLSFFVSPPPGGGGGGGVVSPPGQTPPGGGGGVLPPGGENPPGQPTELVVTPPAVPEPGTWAMMLLGFGLIGWTLRRERAQHAATRAA